MLNESESKESFRWVASSEMTSTKLKGIVKFLEPGSFIIDMASPSSNATISIHSIASKTTWVYEVAKRFSKWEISSKASHN